MDNNIEKKHLFGHMVHDKDDYGIYTYFNYNDTVYRSKLISAIYENQYILISDHCDKCDHYCMRNDIEELLKINQVQIIETKEYDPFDPNIHELRKPLYDNYLNYYVKEVIEEGFIQGTKVLKKAIVEIERRDLDE